MRTAGSAAAQTSRAGARFELMDSMRALAALSVLLFHVTFAFPPPGGLWAAVTSREAGPPVTGVVLFFVISGFLLYRPFVEARLQGTPMPPLVPYAVRRLARIVPAYWVILAIVTVWLGLREVQSVEGVIRYFGFLQLYGPTEVFQGGIGPAWTLCVEVTFYAALPLLALATRRLGRGRSPLASEVALCVALVALSLAWQFAIIAIRPGGESWLLPLLWTLPGSLGLFAAGMALAVASVAVERRETAPAWASAIGRAPWVPWLAALAALFAVGRMTGLQDIGFAAWYVPTLTLKALAAALLLLPVVFGAREGGWLRRALGWRPLLWLGAVSYSIYLWHTPLLSELVPRFADDGQAVLLAAVLAATLVLSALTYYGVERPAQRLARARLRRGSPVAPAPVPVLPEPEPVRVAP